MSNPLKELQDELRILQSMISRCPMNAEEDERVRLAMIRMDEVIREIERIEGLSPAGESKMDTLPEMPPLTPPSDDPPTRPGTPEPSAQEFCDECGALILKYTQHGCGIGRFRGGSAFGGTSSSPSTPRPSTSSPPPTPPPSTPPPRTPAQRAKRPLFVPNQPPQTPDAPTREECKRRSPSQKKRRIPTASAGKASAGTAGAAAAEDASATENTHSVELRF